jgi:hypothetical protein
MYIHEFIDIIGHNRANYMHHMTANWSPIAQRERHQLCYGVWGTVGTTRRWPEVVNLWEEDGFDGLATSFRHEFNHATLQDPFLAKWWARAANFRSVEHTALAMTSRTTSPSAAWGSGTSRTDTSPGPVTLTARMINRVPCRVRWAHPWPSTGSPQQRPPAPPRDDDRRPDSVPHRRRHLRRCRNRRHRLSRIVAARPPGAGIPAAGIPS